MTKAPAVTVITGEGKGKTTAALGMAFSVFLEGSRVLVVQFLKGTGYTGELWTVAQLGDRFQIRQFGAGCIHSKGIRNGTELCRRCGECFRENRKPVNRFAESALSFASHEAASGDWDFMVLDEISHSVNRGLIDVAEVRNLLAIYRNRMQFVLTGRNMPDELRAVADQITECTPIRHPIEQGILGRRGIEY